MRVAVFFGILSKKQTMAYKGSQPSDVRAHNRAANGACDEYKQLKVLSMGRQKAVIKARREAKTCAETGFAQP
ncbi:hypothetical protein ACP0HM_02070 [Escherichia coli]